MKRHYEESEEIVFRAKRTRQCPGQPLPIPLASITGQPPSNFIWKSYKGRLETSVKENNAGRFNFVTVNDKDHVESLYTHGFFGTIVINRSNIEAEYESSSWDPGVDFERVRREDDTNKNWEENDSFWNDNSKDEEKDVNKEETKTTPCDKSDHKANQQLTESETSDHKEKKENKEKIEKNKEKSESDGPQSWSEVASFNQNVSLSDVSLQLELCEAFYLSHALGCLVVSVSGEEDSDQEMSLLQMWRQYSKLEPDFPYRYAAYHHFRSRGWVTRSGYSMGSDWLLYKLGPPFYHASFTVYVEAVSGSTGKVVSKPGLIHPVTWTQLLALNRLNENVNKHMLLARVEEHGVQPQDFLSPTTMLPKLAVSLKRMKRWQPRGERWDEKPQVPVQMHNKT